MIDRAEYDALIDRKARGIGELPQRTGTIYFRDRYVIGARPLAFPEPAAPGEDEPLAAEPRVDDLAAFYSEQNFRAIEPVLEGLPHGTDLLGLLSALDAEFLTSDYGESHSLRARGFLNTMRVRTQTFETSAAIYKLRPFGYVEGGREITKWIAIFENDRLQRVVPYTGGDDWSIYVAE